MSSADQPVAGEAIALVDLGDTLSECSPALHAKLRALRRPGEPEDDVTRSPWPDYLEARRREVMALDGFWRELAPREAGFTLLRELRALEFRVFIVTKAPSDVPHVWADKVAWCRAHVPDLPVIVTDDKSRVHGHVLVDDWLPYVERWQVEWPSGLAVVPAQAWNAQGGVGRRRVRDDPATHESVLQALRTRRDEVMRTRS